MLKLMDGRTERCEIGNSDLDETCEGNTVFIKEDYLALKMKTQGWRKVLKTGKQDSIKVKLMESF